MNGQPLGVGIKVLNEGLVLQITQEGHISNFIEMKKGALLSHKEYQNNIVSHE